VDTNIVSYLMSGKEPASMCARHLEGRVAAVSFQSVGELWYGAVKGGWAERKIRVLNDRIARFVVLAYDEATVRAWAELKVQAETSGLSKSAADLWIAATARRHNLPLLSNDRGFLSALDITVVRPEDPPT
jgi:predicted nucleic acid-binding protein